MHALEDVRSHCFRLGDQVRLLFLDVLCEAGIYLFVTRTSLGNDEVQENDATDDHNDGPHQPEKVSRFGVKVEGGTDAIVVTQSSSENIKEVSDE